MVLYVEPDYGPALELRNFIGPRADGFRPDHPLARGFHAALKRSRGQKISLDAIRQISEVNLIANAVQEHLIGHARKSAVIRHLSNTDDVRALRFEALTLKLIVEPKVRHAVWRRYERHVTDILTAEPMIQVECKLVKKASIETILDRATDDVSQRSIGEGPFVLVGGTDQLMSAHQLDAAESFIRAQEHDWFRRHPEVAAVLILMPVNVPKDEWLRESPFGPVLLRFDDMRGLWLRNNFAEEPLPPNFELRLSARGITS